MPQTVLDEAWAEFKDVRFVQNEKPKAGQPINPAYGGHHGLEAADWVEGIAYSSGKYNEARMIPRQIQQGKVDEVGGLLDLPRDHAGLVVFAARIRNALNPVGGFQAMMAAIGRIDGLAGLGLLIPYQPERL